MLGILLSHDRVWEKYRVSVFCRSGPSVPTILIPREMVWWSLRKVYSMPSTRPHTIIQKIRFIYLEEGPPSDGYTSISEPVSTSSHISSGSPPPYNTYIFRRSNRTSTLFLPSWPHGLEFFFRESVALFIRTVRLRTRRTFRIFPLT